VILILFSGGVESTVLLKHLLKNTDELIHVLFTKLGYDNVSKNRVPEQVKAATNVLEYLQKNYRNFNYSTAELNLNNITRKQQEENGFGFDEQWNIFFASLYARLHGITDIWIGQFSYNDTHRLEYNLPPLSWFYNGTIEKYALLGTGLDFNFYKELKINFPSRNFKNQGIDSFNSKKEAFDYLEPELQKMVRSCEGTEKFCGKCIKCIQYKDLKFIKD
jgi:7-cyano-7-deazaguanine synthase in queuosine biosynthesis